MSQPLPDPNERGVAIAAYKPFWRWAVVARARPDLTGIPFYRLRAALDCLDEMRAKVPETKPALVRHRLIGRVEDVQA